MGPGDKFSGSPAPLLTSFPAHLARFEAQKALSRFIKEKPCMGITNKDHMRETEQSKVLPALSSSLRSVRWIDPLENSVALLASPPNTQAVVNKCLAVRWWSWGCPCYMGRMSHTGIYDQWIYSRLFPLLGIKTCLFFIVELRRSVERPHRGAPIGHNQSEQDTGSESIPQWRAWDHF